MTDNENTKPREYVYYDVINDQLATSVVKIKGTLVCVYTNQTFVLIGEL